MRAKRRRGESGGEEPQLVHGWSIELGCVFYPVCFLHSLKYSGFNFYVAKTKAASFRFVLPPQWRSKETDELAQAPKRRDLI